MTSTTGAIAGDLAPTGVLRASINLGNPVLAQGPATEPVGVTVDIAREVAARLGLPVGLVCFDAARTSFEALTEGRADICFLAVEPAREAEVAFTAPYVVIEGVFAVPVDSSARTPDDIDQPGVRIGVKRGSAYDLYLSRTLQHATVVRGDEGVDVFLDERLDAAAGIRQPLTAFVDSHPGMRMIDERFMQIQQAVGTTRTRRPETVAFLREASRTSRPAGSSPTPCGGRVRLTPRSPRSRRSPTARAGAVRRTWEGEPSLRVRASTDGCAPEQGAVRACRLASHSVGGPPPLRIRTCSG